MIQFFNGFGILKDYVRVGKRVRVILRVNNFISETRASCWHELQIPDFSQL